MPDVGNSSRGQPTRKTLEKAAYDLGVDKIVTERTRQEHRTS
ncbi:hypothetical protein [Streptomyces sp. NPDC058614]